MKRQKYIKEILKLNKSKKYKEAYSLLNQALAIYPNNLFLKKFEIFLLKRIGKIDEAYIKAQNLYNELKDDEFFIQTYLLLLEKKGEKDSLKNLIQNILIENKSYSDKFYDFLLKITLRHFKDKELEQIKDKFPNYKEIPNYKKYKLKFASMSLTDAIQEIENLMILPNYQNDTDLCLYLASLYKKTKQYGKALEIYKKLLTKDPDSKYIQKMTGYIYYNLQDYKNALIYLREAVLKDPEDVILLNTLFKIYEKDKDFDEFKKLGDEIIARHPHVKKIYGYMKKAEKWKQN